MIEVGSIWKKLGSYWGAEEGNYVIVTRVEEPYIQYRYIEEGWHGDSSGWNVESFLKKFQLVMR